MKKVILKLYEFDIAEIIDENGLTVIDNEENIKNASKKYPLNMRSYSKGLSGYNYPIETYFNAFNRKYIIKEAQIKESDSVFEKLYKVAGLNLIDFNGFNIKQK